MSRVQLFGGSMPLSGMDNKRNDAALMVGGDSPRHYVRDALNVDITDAARATIRNGKKKISALVCRDVWQSPLHKDVFAVVGNMWGKINVADWSFAPMIAVGSGKVWHLLLNNRVAFSCDNGIFQYDGATVQPIGSGVVAPEDFEGSDLRYLSPMPSGKYLSEWNGRIMVAQSNILRFSEALFYHMHSEIHGFIQFPQRITFVAPVDSGIWVGQVTHVCFLRGTELGEMSMERKALAPPIPDSATTIDAKDAKQASGGGAKTALWLSESGFVLGTSDGQAVELQSEHIKGVAGHSASSVVLDGRIYASVV